MSCTSCFDNEQKIDEINAEILVILYFRRKYCEKWIDSDGIRTHATEVTGA